MFVTCALTVGLLLMGVLNVGHWLSAPRRVPTQANLIVALGGGRGIERLRTALLLYQRGYAERILLTGFSGVQGGDHYTRWESKYLLERGVPRDALLFDDQSATSYEEANHTALLMKSRQWKTALVVSDPPHLRRLAMVWGPACSQNDIQYHLISTEPSTWDPSAWWRDKVWAKFVGMELVKLAYYALAY